MKRSINVCIIPSWYKNYGEEMVGQRYDEAVDLQKYCNVAIFHPYDRSLSDEICVHVEGGIVTYRSLLRDGERVNNNIRLWKAFKRMWNEFHPDIIFAHVGNEGGKIASFFSRIYRIPLVLAEHSAVEALGLVPGGKKKDYRLLKCVYGSCDYVSCVSEGLKNDLQRCFPKLKFHVICNGVQPISRYAKKQEGQYRKNGVINLVIVAGFYNKEIKGYQFLLPAIKEIRKLGNDVVLHICGDGRWREYYEKMAKELGIEKECIFYGYCSKEKVYAIVGQADFFVSASIFESGGIAVEEAMLLGKPIVVTKSGGANSLVTENTAIVIEKGSTQALVDGIEEMIRRYDSFDADKIKQYAENKFEISHISRQYMEIFQSLLTR